MKWVPRLYAANHLLIGLGLFLCAPSLAQQVSAISQAGTSTPGSYQPNGIDTINLRNGSLTLNIPIISYPQLGNKLKLSFSLQYSPTSWVYLPGPETLVKNPNGGFLGEYTGDWYDSDLQAPTPIGVTLTRDQELVPTTVQLSYPCTPGNCPPNNAKGPTATIATLASLVTADRGVHNYGLNDNGGHYFYLPTLDGTNFVPLSSGPAIPTSFLGPNGVKYTAVQDSSNSALGAFNQTDPDGNTVTVSSAGWTDTVGRQIPGAMEGPGDGHLTRSTYGEPTPGVVTSDLSHCATGTSAARAWNVPGPYQTTSTYYLCFTQLSAATAFNELNAQFSSGLAYSTEPGGQGVGKYLFLTQLVLPNNTSYTFTYDNYLNLLSVHLPTGGSVKYGWITMNWPGGVDIAHQQTRMVQTRTTYDLDGSICTWTYSYTPIPYEITSGNTLVTDPNGNDETHAFTENPTTTETISSYTGTGSARVLLKTTVRMSEPTRNPFAYPNAGSSYGSPLPGPLTSEVTTWAATNQVKQTTYSMAASTGNYTYYNFNDQQESGSVTPNEFEALTCPLCWSTFQPQTINEYDYGIGQPGPLLRSTTTIYQWQHDQNYAAANLLTLPYSTAIVDGTGNQLSYVLYSYDENNGSPQGVLGHLTTNATQNVDANTSSQFVYNAEGIATTTIDGNQNQSRVMAFQCSGLFPQVVIAPYQATTTVAETRTLTYDCNTGALLSSQDPNKEVTYYVYKDPLGRATGVTYPDGGSVSISYNGDAIPLAVTNITATGELAGPVVTTTVYDGFGRVTGTQLNSDLAGPVLVDITYDPVGHTGALSNPYRLKKDSTYGVTTYTYDGLGRTLMQCQADNGSDRVCTPGRAYLQWQFSGNTTTQTDENGNSWQRTADGLGRVTKVVEPNGAVTTYSYDALSNLTSVVQYGVSGETTRNRRFTYDSLSRVVTATNPETKTICYGQWSGNQCKNGYDPNGNLINKTDARGVVTKYSYDGLNRLISKVYTNAPAGSFSSCYQYDNATNGVGRLAASWTQAGSCSAQLPATGFLTSKVYVTYDVMGRLQKQQQCVPGKCAAQSGSPFTMNYAYDLAGNTTSMDDGLGQVSWTSSYDGADRLLSVNGAAAPGLPNPVQLFANPAYNSAGQVTNWSVGAVDASTPALTGTRTYDNRLRVTTETVTGHD